MKMKIALRWQISGKKIITPNDWRSFMDHFMRFEQWQREASTTNCHKRQIIQTKSRAFNETGRAKGIRLDWAVGRSFCFFFLGAILSRSHFILSIVDVRLLKINRPNKVHSARDREKTTVISACEFLIVWDFFRKFAISDSSQPFEPEFILLQRAPCFCCCCDCSWDSFARVSVLREPFYSADVCVCLWAHRKNFIVGVFFGLSYCSCLCAVVESVSIREWKRKKAFVSVWERDCKSAIEKKPHRMRR